MSVLTEVMFSIRSPAGPAFSGFFFFFTASPLNTMSLQSDPSNDPNVRRPLNCHIDHMTQ